MRRSRTPQSWRLVGVAVLTVLLVWQAAHGELARLWMVWDVVRPDSGRVSQPADPIAYWSAKRVIADRVELRTTPTPPTPETIPMPIAPGSRVTGFEIPPEDVKPVSK